MNRFSIAILESAPEAAAPAQIEPDVDLRLALAWLVLDGVADQAEVTRYWQSLTKPPFDQRAWRPRPKPQRAP